MTTQVWPLLTVDDLDLMPDDGNRYELIEGELFMSRAPGLTHQRISMSFAGCFMTYLNQSPVGEIVATPGVIFSQYNAVIPDLVFYSNERRSEIASTERVIGAPDIIIEIVSPGAENERRDRVVKRQLYGKYQVKEYWIVYPETRTIELYHLRDQIMELASTLTDQDEITSPLLPGFSCKVADIFKA